jgi:hypothetical protein
MSYFIAFDIAHNPRGRIKQNYTALRKSLNSNHFVCEDLFEPLITQASLEPYDILVFVCPDFSEISLQERMEIKTWISEEGGGLLMISHAGGDKGRKSNLSELSEQFGVLFENNQVLDQKHNIGWENLPIITTLSQEHPILEGIDEICYRAGCSLTTTENKDAIILSNETSEPPNTPLLTASQLDKGRIVCIGSYEMFRDNTKGGFQYSSHSKLCQNIFKWLLSQYRKELSSKSSPQSFSEAPELEGIQKDERQPEKEPKTEFLRSREDIDAELNALTKKLASTQKILGYVKKKRDRGEMNEKTYQTRSESLHSQITELKEKIQKLKSQIQEKNFRT